MNVPQTPWQASQIDVSRSSLTMSSPCPHPNYQVSWILPPKSSPLHSLLSNLTVIALVQAPILSPVDDNKNFSTYITLHLHSCHLSPLPLYLTFIYFFTSLLLKVLHVSPSAPSMDPF